MSDLSFEHVLSSQYTVFDGLAGMHVEDIYQDRQGFLWVATADGGVSRFDSARFDTFGLKDGVVAHLQGYAWPGNVRELEHVIQRAVLLCKDGVMRVEDVALPSVALPAGDGEHPSAERRTGDADEEVDEKQQILEALQATHWRVSGVHGAAALLGMHPEKLRYRMQKYGLRRPKP